MSPISDSVSRIAVVKHWLSWPIAAPTTPGPLRGYDLSAKYEVTNDKGLGKHKMDGFMLVPFL